MSRIKKIRGHKRIWDRIDQWKVNALNLDMDELQARQREYIKVYVFPFFSIDALNSVTPPPKGNTRTVIIHALFEIYSAWKIQLDSLVEPYYLKIWFFPENVGKSQVVCAIGDMIEWYDHTFFQPESTGKMFDSTIFGNAGSIAASLNWEFAIDELSIDDDYLGNSDDWESMETYFDARRWLKRKMKKPHREIQFGEHTYYNFPQNNVWIGG